MAHAPWSSNIRGGGDVAGRERTTLLGMKSHSRARADLGEAGRCPELDVVERLQEDAAKFLDGRVLFIAARAGDDCFEDERHPCRVRLRLAQPV